MTQTEFYVKDQLFNRIIGLVIEITKLTIKEDGIYQDNDIISWDEFIGLDFQTQVDNLNGLLLFGDCTLEFCCDETQEAENWASFSNEILCKVINELENILHN